MLTRGGARLKALCAVLVAVVAVLTALPSEAGASPRPPSRRAPARPQPPLRATKAKAATPAPPAVVGAKATAGHSCNSQAVVSCLLPYPSEQFMRPDPTSATGYRIDVPADILPKALLEQFGPGTTVQDAYGSADGFSVLTPVVFELPDMADPASLPADGGGAFVVVDLDTGRRVPMKVEVSRDAERLWGKDRIVVGFPRDRFRYGGRYLAVLTDQLRGPGGTAIRRGPGLNPSRSLSQADRQAATRLDQQIAAALPGMDRSRVLTATAFVVRSEQDVTGDIDRMAALVRADQHPIRNVWVSPSIVAGTQAVTGQVRVTDFRDDDGVIATGDRITSRPHWIDFMLVMPQYPASGRGAPVAIYGHGLSVQRETMLTVAGENARKGIATIGVDIPNHGSRWWAEGGYLTELATPYRFGRMASMPLQGIMDNLSLLMAVKTSFSTLDVHPVQNWWTSSWGNGVPDLDTRHVIYQGTSMGGFLGASFVPLAPAVEGAFIQVGGTGIVDTIFHSWLWPLFWGIAPWGSTAGDAHALLGAAGMLLDRSDNVYLLDRIRRNGTPFYLVYGEGDGIVPSASSERMVRLLDLPLLAPTYHDVPGVRVVGSMAPDGTGASQFPTWDAAQKAGPFLPLLAHTWFSTDRPAAEMDRWIEQRLAAMHLER